jgi:biotin-dependent carboxylase-like uncharacterized protein
MIEVLSTGAPNSVQDLGRDQVLRHGVSRSGAMDRTAHAIANLLVGNDEAAATIEVALFPCRLKFKSRVTFACCGADSRITLGERVVPTWWVTTAQAGDTLVVEAPTRGARVVIAVQGGIDVPPVLGSRATDLKSGFGGIEGRGLKRGEEIAIAAAGPQQDLPRGVGVIPAELPELLAQVAAKRVHVRVLAGAELERFTPRSVEQFLGSDYVVTPEANRMGYRLQGAPLALTAPVELLSHGIVPGTIQVPPAGQPIIQLAEANTCGGYPKIANVISADLWRLAQTPVGCALRFEMVEQEQAVRSLKAQREERQVLRRDLPLMLARG